MASDALNAAALLSQGFCASHGPCRRRSPPRPRPPQNGLFCHFLWPPGLPDQARPFVLTLSEPWELTSGPCHIRSKCVCTSSRSVSVPLLDHRGRAWACKSSIGIHTQQAAQCLAQSGGCAVRPCSTDGHLPTVLLSPDFRNQVVLASLVTVQPRKLRPADSALPSPLSLKIWLHSGSPASRSSHHRVRHSCRRLCAMRPTGRAESGSRTSSQAHSSSPGSGLRSLRWCELWVSHPALFVASCVVL